MWQMAITGSRCSFPNGAAQTIKENAAIWKSMFASYSNSLYNKTKEYSVTLVK